jgi:Pretoxin HINT domain/A nuclease of the HNH/ENDO VII superfamily with conserved WHH
VFAAIDATSVVLAFIPPFVLDAASDFVGIVAGVYYDDYGQVALYSAALVIPVSGVIKKGFTEGKMAIKNADGTWKFSDNIVDLKFYAKNIYQKFDYTGFKNLFNVQTYGKIYSKTGGTAIGAVAQRGTKDVIEVEAKQVLEQVTEDYALIGVLKDADIRMMDNGPEFMETAGDVVVAEYRGAKAELQGSKCFIGSGLCFAKGTLVKTEKGDLPIEQITEGVSVWSYDEKSHTKVLNKVAKVLRNATTKMMRLVVGKDTILTTPEHPFYALDPAAEVGGRWTKAGELKQNFKVLLLSGMMAMVNMVQPIDTIATVYNFEVEKTHNYYVGTEGVLVHNDCLFNNVRRHAKRGVTEFEEAQKFVQHLRSFTKEELEVFYKATKDNFTDDQFAIFIKEFNAESNIAFRQGIVRDPALAKAWRLYKSKDIARLQIIKKWTSGKNYKYGTLTGTDAETRIFADLENVLNNKNVTEVLEDGQGRLSVVVSRPGQTNQVVTVHPTNVANEFKITTFEPAYNPALNPNINVPLSTNRLAPDYANTTYLHPLNRGKTIRIKMTGKRTGSSGDFALADTEMRIIETSYVKPNNYTWHHLDDFDPITGECTMQLVESSAHQGSGVLGMAHSGSVAQWKAYYGTASNAPGGLFY